MYIHPNDNSVNMYGSRWNPDFWNRLKQKALEAFPDATIKSGKRKVESWENINERISRPAENRLIMGATALATQPLIDYTNHRVDKETREISYIRTISKIIAGTLVGIAVRGSCYKLVREMTNIKGHEKWSKALMPKNYLNDLISDETLLKNYRNALSTFVALMAMCVTNFAIDAPLTVFLTNKLNAHRTEKLAKDKQAESKGDITYA